MSGVEPLGDLDSQVHQTLHLQGPGFDQMLEGLSVHELHDDKVLPVFFTDIVNGADVGVVQSLRRFGLSSKSLNPGRTSLGLPRKEIQRNHALPSGILRFVYYAHAATTQTVYDA